METSEPIEPPSPKDKDQVSVHHAGDFPTKQRREGISLNLARFSRKNSTRREIEDEVRKQIKSQDEDLPEEVLEKIVHEIASDVKGSKSSESLPARLLLVFIPFALITLVTLLFSSIVVRQVLDPMIEKTPIQQDILAAIKNGADVEMLKVVFKTRAKSQESLAALVRRKDFYQSANATLMTVLNDLKTSIYVQTKAVSDEDKSTIGKIDILLTEYNKINPFDGLEDNQRRDLNNLAKKLSPADYLRISDDVASIVVELKSKNNLVTKYLNSSDISLWLSIVALALTVGLAFWQFRPKARKTQKELIQEALAEFNMKRSNERSEA